MANHPIWNFIHPKMTYDHLGYLPQFLDLDDPRPAKEQLHSNYAHGGGWFSFKGFEHVEGTDFDIKYPGDPAYPALAYTDIHGETVVFYPHSWVGIWKDGQLQDIARMD